MLGGNDTGHTQNDRLHIEHLTQRAPDNNSRFFAPSSRNNKVLSRRQDSLFHAS